MAAAVRPSRGADRVTKNQAPLPSGLCIIQWPGGESDQGECDKEEEDGILLEASQETGLWGHGFAAPPIAP